MHDSEPVRIANPSPYETFIHNTLPVFTGAPKSETNQETQNQTSQSAKGSFGILCFLTIRICFEFGISSFEFIPCVSDVPAIRQS